MLLTPCHNLSISAGGQCLCPLVVFVSLTFVSHLCSSLDSEGATERICVAAGVCHGVVRQRRAKRNETSSPFLVSPSKNDEPV